MFAEQAAAKKTAETTQPKLSGVTKKSRKYDMSITYDFYTQTPRLWLMGYGEDGAPLTGAQTFEDIAAEQAKKTVTMVDHPHTGVK